MEKLAVKRVHPTELKMKRVHLKQFKPKEPKSTRLKTVHQKSSGDPTRTRASAPHARAPQVATVRAKIGPRGGERSFIPLNDPGQSFLITFMFLFRS